jgi:hypothetical protein
MSRACPSSRLSRSPGAQASGEGGQHTLVELPLGARPLPANTDPARYERAALRWLGRFIDERSPPLTEVALAASALRLELHRKTATNVGPLTPIGGGRGEFAVELSLSRPLPQSQRGDGERTIAHVTEAAGPPRPIFTQRRHRQTRAVIAPSALLVTPSDSMFASLRPGWSLSASVK